jgi:hypothetical protein
MKHYRAPWGNLLIMTSLALTILCLGIAVVVSQSVKGPLLWSAALPLLIALGCALFTIRGYTVTPDAILVHRLFWATELSRGGLTSAQFAPNAMRRSIRTFGNGGFFSFSGFHWNKPLGTYRAFVTDLRKTVVLRYRSHRPIVLSPEAPETFVRDVNPPGAAAAPA